MEYFCYLRTAQKDRRQKNCIRKTFLGKTFDGPHIPCGASVEYFPITAEDMSRVHQFGKKRDILGRVLRAGGIWCDLLLADCRVLQELESAEVHVGIFQSLEALRQWDHSKHQTALNQHLKSEETLSWKRTLHVSRPSKVNVPA